ncbi:uncharacterized protein IUM83_16180 [Phytophthora cinnamomi]|uniref:uncharacterized protein n=1 Tax=Phytophthora cinnamomi TaxID=4785 RepID=UPI00355AB543|nr:hypothetical protein IUM83_16180 [Phytophthora cinnamomi]
MLEPRTAEFHLDWTCRNHLSRAPPSSISTGRVEVASAERRRARSRRDVSKSARPGIAEFHVGWGVLDLSAAEFHLDRTCGSRLRRASPSSISSGRIEVVSAERRRVPRRLERAGSERRRVPSRPDVWKSPPPSVAELDLVGTYRSRLDRASPSSASAGACWSLAPPSSISTGRVEVASAERRRARSRRDVSKSARPGIAEFRVGWGMLEPRTAEFHLDWTCRSHLTRASPSSTRPDVWKSPPPSVAELDLVGTYRSRLDRASPSSASAGACWSLAPPSSIWTGRVAITSAERRRVPSRPDVWKSPPPSVAELDLVGTYRSRLDRASPSSTSAGACWI